MNDALLQKYEKHLLNEGLTEARRDKLKMLFHLVSRELNLETANRGKIENFLENLNKNKFQKLDSKPYAGNTKRDIKKFIKQFLKWLKGNLCNCC